MLPKHRIPVLLVLVLAVLVGAWALGAAFGERRTRSPEDLAQGAVVDPLAGIPNGSADARGLAPDAEASWPDGTGEAGTPTPAKAKDATAGAPAADPSVDGSGMVRFDASDFEERSRPEPIVDEVLARTALASVGRDRRAEAIWRRAIDDPGLSASFRSDLIEDLNEEGFADPDHATEADLPLILARMRLIEALAPYAMDEVNAAAFQEAYKDLLDMFLRLRGVPPR